MNNNKESWWHFAAYNSQSNYGYGTGAEADAYRDYLNRNLEVNQYSATEMTDDEAIEKDLNSYGMNLADELQSLRDEGLLRGVDTINRTRRLLEGWYILGGKLIEVAQVINPDKPHAVRSTVSRWFHGIHIATVSKEQKVSDALVELGNDLDHLVSLSEAIDPGCTDDTFAEREIALITARKAHAQHDKIVARRVFIHGNLSMSWIVEDEEGKLWNVPQAIAAPVSPYYGYLKGLKPVQPNIARLAIINNRIDVSGVRDLDEEVI